MADITKLIHSSSLSPWVKEKSLAVFDRIALAEGKIHGQSPDQVHFHEVGAVDTIADIVGAAIGWDLLRVDRIVCSPIPTGRGFVNIAHGRVSVPAPATAELLKGIPLADADVPVVMVHDDMVWSSGPIFQPAWYREYVFPNYKKCFAPLLDAGKKIMFTSDGGFDAFIDDIADAGVHGFAFEPLTSLEYIVERYGQTHVIIGNADTRILLSGTREQIRAEVERCMSLGRDCPGFFMAVGNHVPPNTPVASALYYNEVYEELCQR